MLPKVNQIGPYELLERIGVGGMAEVFKARQRGAQGFERLLAIKRILPNIAADQGFVNMFIDEAKVAVQLQHPNIAQIYDLGRDDEELFIALEYIDGKDMKAINERQAQFGKPLPLSFVVHVVMKVCEALNHAHFAQGANGPLHFIHRDISPQNILVSYEGAVKVIDFGLARATGRLSQTRAGIVKGKFAYLSSEQARGLDIDHRSDIFSLGTCFFEWLTGRRLFIRNSDPDTIIAVQKAQVPPLRAIRPELPSALQHIVSRALQADPNDRYQSAAEMQEDLLRFSIEAGLPTRRRNASDFMLKLFPGALPEPEPEPPLRPSFQPALTTTLPTSQPPRSFESPIAESHTTSLSIDELLEEDFGSDPLPDAGAVDPAQWAQEVAHRDVSLDLISSRPAPIRTPAPECSQRETARPARPIETGFSDDEPTFAASVDELLAAVAQNQAYEAEPPTQMVNLSDFPAGQDIMETNASNRPSSEPIEEEKTEPNATYDG